MKDFREFLLRGNVVDLAVAVVIGTAFTALVTSLVANLFTPLIAAIVGKPDFAQLTFTINKSVFYYGRFLNSLIAFLAIAAVIYFVVVAPVSRINERRRRGQMSGLEDPTLTDEARRLTEIRDLLATGRR